MDVMGLATAAVGLLAQVIGQDTVGDLVAWVREHVRGGPADAALDGFERAPDDPRAQGSLSYAIAHLISQNPDLADELAALLERTGPPAATVSDAGAVAIGGDVRVSGTYAAGRDLTIGTPPER